MYNIYKGKFCDTVFEKTASRNRHMKKFHPIEYEAQVDKEAGVFDTPAPKRRVRYSLSQKIRAILLHFMLLSDGYLQPGAVTSHSLNVPKGTFDKWLAGRQGLLQLYLTYPCLRRKKKICIAPRGQFHEAEEALYLKFVYRRSVLKLPVSQEWLKDEFKIILTEQKPEGWENFCYSPGWVTGFCVRFSICDRAMTNKKSHSVLERLPIIRQFHRYLIYLLPRMSAVQQCPKYGRFAARNRYHMDQIPMPFVFSSKRTLHFKGATDVPIRHPDGSGLEKRQCTLQLTIRAEGPQNIRPMLIFRGAGHVGRAELQYYESLGSIQVAWQAKAWADRRIMMDWLECFDEDIGGSGTTRPEVMLGMDQHGSQMVDEFLDGMVERNIFGVYTPVNCTDVTAPIDHHVGARLKSIISGLYVRDFSRNMERWLDHLTAGERRMYIASWVVEAWDLLKVDGDFFKKVFQSTGFCNAQDGSENHLVTVGSDVVDYDIDAGDDELVV